MARRRESTVGYIRPGFLTTRVLNPFVAFLTGRLGLSLKGARLLSVQGRRTGAWHSTPVNPLTLAGQRYLVSPRGETQWVRNLRVTPVARLTLGRRTETVRVEEIADGAKVPILRAYLREWAGEVGRFFGGLEADAPGDALARIASRHPVFRILPG
jgi:hypothetical protein